jgi:signal peptidase I
MTARLSFVAMCAVVLSLTGCNRRAFTVPGESMEPTFRRGDQVTADMWAYALHPPKRWDVVVLHPRADDLKDVVWVMRVVALPGEKVSFSDGRILIDGTPVVPPPQVAAIHFKDLGSKSFSSGAGPIIHPYTVPKDCYYVVGDNPLAAYDSRAWGALPRGNILGRVLDK